MSGEAVLRRTRAADLVVGSNRRGEMSGGGWLYALPRLGFGAAVCLGEPSETALTTLARSTTSLIVWPTSARAERRLSDLVARRGWEAITIVRDLDEALGGSFELLVIPGADAAPDAAVRAAAALERLEPGGTAFIAGPVAADARVSEPAATRGSRAVTVSMERGDVRSVIPSEDEGMRRAIERLGLFGPTTRFADPRLARPERRLRHVVRRPLLPAEREALIVGPGEGSADGPPAYVTDLAANAGLDLTQWGWAVAARGDYDSQKVLVLLRPPDRIEPTGVVKVTRSAMHAGRLENETAVLERLAALPVAAGRAPVPWFSGRHAGRALLGESLMDGVPFASRARWDPACPGLADALSWLTELGAATRVPVPAAAVSVALLDLLDRYVAAHPSEPHETAHLRSRFAALARIDAPIPTVLLHGDPGIWNLLADGHGRTVFLDWESAEPDGLPLWDLLTFARSYAVAASRRDGVRDRLEGAARHLLEPSPLGDRLRAAITEYCDTVGVPPSAVEALTYGCWVYRATKEATRLAPGRAGSGQFARLIRRMVERPSTPLTHPGEGGP